jgi:hypothetical protein
MDDRRFDDLTRRAATSRRGVLRALAGAAGAALLGVGGLDAAPRCKRKGQRCQTTTDCCPAENGTVCAANKTCQPCPAATPSLCGGQCVDKSDDNLNCGACGNACFGGSSCVNGACQCPADKPHRCADGSCQACCANADCATPDDPNAVFRCCGNACVNVLHNDINCGECGNICGPKMFCRDFDCSCSGNPCFGDSSNCCDLHVCGPQETCVPCNPEGESCAQGACCDGLFCHPEANECIPCLAAGRACAYPNVPDLDRACCSGDCSNGVCV